MTCQKFSPFSWVFCLIILAQAAVHAAEAPFPIEGLTDKRYPGYTDWVTFRIPATPGYSYYALLDTNPVPTDVSIEVNKIDYHTLSVTRTNLATLAVTNQFIQFVVRSSERNASQSTEDGIPVWTPYPLINSTSNELQGARLRLIAPQDFPAGYEIPLVAWVRTTKVAPSEGNGPLTAAGHPSIKIFRGVGSGLLSSNNPAGALNYQAHLQGLQTNKLINIEASPAWTSVSGVLGGNTTWPAGARMLVTGNLTVPAGSTLTIGEGAIVRLNALVDIFLDGELTINGTVDRPVVFMPNARSQAWGGFWLRFDTSRLVGTGAIFTGSGGNPTWFGTEGRPNSHRVEQALFYCTNTSPRVTLTDSAAIFLAGQLGHAVNGGTLTYTRFLMQRLTTGGEYTGANFNVNDSALIECPDDTGNFVDGDNDGLYVIGGTSGFTNSLFGWMKDDGIDSGGSGGGIINYQRCWFESIFHEANSLSGTGKRISHYDGVIMNCGQGVEDGYDAPTGRVERCFVTANLTGVRFGDNYASPYNYGGTIRATNSIILHNHRDVWGMNFQDWAYRVSAMDIQNNFLTLPNTNHPNNAVWNPATDGWRLAAFMTTPPDAPVGIGLATREGQFDLPRITNGIPVRLSSFTTNFVSVDYTIESPTATVLNGTLTFAPGETVKLIPVPLAQPRNYELLRVALRNPVSGEFTGLTRAYYLNLPTSALVTQGSVWKHLDNGSNQSNAWQRLDYNDAAWPAGRAELGFGDGDEATLVASNRQATTYFRHTFNVPDPTAFSFLGLLLRRDDGGAVYINTNEVYRSPNMPGAFTYTSLTVGSSAENAIDIVNISPSVLVAGANIVAVEIHQQALDSSDLSFDLELTGVFVPRSPRLEIRRFGNEVAIVWTESGYELQQADALDGSWQTRPNAVSPVTIVPTTTQFFRLQEL